MLSLIPTQLETEHAPVYREVQNALEACRSIVGLEPDWTIDVRILCPDELIDSEAAIYWHAEVWFARLMVRCDAPSDLIPRLVLHELLELQRWKTTDNTCKQLALAKVTEYGEVWRLFEQEQKEMRNQEIEQMVTALLGQSRSHHLSAPFEYRNVHSSLPGFPTPASTQRHGHTHGPRVRNHVRRPLYKTVRGVNVDSIVLDEFIALTQEEEKEGDEQNTELNKLIRPVLDEMVSELIEDVHNKSKLVLSQVE